MNWYSSFGFTVDGGAPDPACGTYTMEVVLTKPVSTEYDLLNVNHVQGSSFSFDIAKTANSAVGHSAATVEVKVHLDGVLFHTGYFHFAIEGICDDIQALPDSITSPLTVQIDMTGLQCVPITIDYTPQVCYDAYGPGQIVDYDFGIPNEAGYRIMKLSETNILAVFSGRTCSQPQTGVSNVIRPTPVSPSQWTENGFFSADLATVVHDCGSFGGTSTVNSDDMSCASYTAELCQINTFVPFTTNYTSIVHALGDPASTPVRDCTTNLPVP